MTPGPSSSKNGDNTGQGRSSQASYPGWSREVFDRALFPGTDVAGREDDVTPAAGGWWTVYPGWRRVHYLGPVQPGTHHPGYTTSSHRDTLLHAPP